MNIDKSGRLEEGMFSYTASKDSRVFINWMGKQVAILAGKKAEAFLKKAAGAPDREIQLLLAKATGNFKRGNEKKSK